MIDKNFPVKFFYYKQFLGIHQKIINIKQLRYNHYEKELL